jgi:hypothetical protein
MDLLFVMIMPIVIILGIGFGIGFAFYNFIKHMRAYGAVVQSLVAYQQQMQVLHQNLMHLQYQQLASRPDLQNDVTQKISAAGEIIPTLKTKERPVAEQELIQILQTLAQGQQGNHWSNGAHFQGGNAVIPGGPSLIDGKLFIPR